MKRTPLRRRTPLRSVGARKLRTQSAERAFREALIARSGGRCEVVTPACPDGWHEGAHGHHCWPSDRDRNIHDPNRGLFVCAPAHDYIHRSPEWSRPRGFLLHDGDVA